MDRLKKKFLTKTKWWKVVHLFRLIRRNRTFSECSRVWNLIASLRWCPGVHISRRLEKKLKKWRHVLTSSKEPPNNQPLSNLWTLLLCTAAAKNNTVAEEDSRYISSHLKHIPHRDQAAAATIHRHIYHRRNTRKKKRKTQTNGSSWRRQWKSSKMAILIN